MKKLQLPNLQRTIRLIGDLMPTKDGDLPLTIMNDLLDYKNDLESFYDTIKELEQDMKSSKAYKDEYIEETLQDIITENSPSLELIINSGGGSVSEGFAIIDLIKELQELYGVEVNTHAIGMCASMAVAVYMAGDIRTAGDNVIFMMHQISGGSVGSQNKIESTINCMNIMNRMYKRMFDGTRMDKETLDDIMSHDVDYYFDIEEARKWGIVNDDDLVEQAMELLSELVEQATDDEVDTDEVDIQEVEDDNSDC